ncbi:hypothetical protein F7Q99_29715 [Streptomyces kaniharaensis]|uniref:Phospholipase n=1 Tax=Streptomyces kaniharaensis TaxID=212423 RepID=A0A6N7KXR2_9ACTN|nr:hypothetical protein [Streptomyces kaniharaensis]MQS16281.1 hypothetical protein [Streptomyces kaniharaensis]
MSTLLRTACPTVWRLWTAAVAASTALVGLVGLPATHASAATSARSATGPMFLTNGAWPDHILCASADNDNVRLTLFDASDPYCQWIRVGDRGQFLLFNPKKQKVATYLGGNEGAVVMENQNSPTPNQQYFSWGGAEAWGAYALQSFWDSGQNVDAKDPNSDSPRTDAVHTRGWRHGYQQELTWYELPVAAQRPTYVFAHNLNSADQVDNALDAGYNAIEVDASFDTKKGDWCYSGTHEWISCDPGNPSSEMVLPERVSRKTTAAILNAMVRARQNGKSLAAVWVDIKPDGEGDQPARISLLRSMVRHTLLAAGIQVMYEVPYSADNNAAWNALKQNLDPLESVAVTGTYSHVRDTFARQGSGIDNKHRFATDGSAVFATFVGGCTPGPTLTDSDKVKGLKESVANREAGNINGVFAWTIGSAPDSEDCAARMLGETGVNGVIAGNRMSDYSKEPDTDDSVKIIKDWVRKHPNQARMATVHDNLFR